MSSAKFTINFDQDEKYYFNLIDEDLSILIQSELYETYSECEYGIKVVQDFGKLNSTYFKKTKNINDYYFVLISPLGELVATSMTFGTKEDRDNSIENVMTVSELAIIYENFD